MKNKILINFTILFLIGVVIIGMISINYSENEYENNLQKSMIDYAKMIANNMESNDSFDFQMDSIKISKLVESRITFIDKDGIVIGDSDADIATLDNHKDRLEIIEAFNGKIGTIIRHSDTLGIDFLYIAYPIQYNGEILVIRVSKPMHELEMFSNNLFNNYMIASIVGIFFALIIGLRFSNYLISPLNELINGTKRISKGNFSEKIYINSNDEFRVLADNFNYMSNEIEMRINETNTINSRLTATLDSMINGIIAISNEKKILFINPEAQKIFHIKENKSMDKKIIEIFRNYELYSVIENYFENKISGYITKEILFEEKYYAININSIYKSEKVTEKIGIIILIQDITEIKKLENMRKDFVANVSHELRTPLTSIKGFIETLRFGNVKDEITRDKFLGIIEIETIRLNNLIEDILVLSDIEKTINVEIEKVEVLKALNEVIDMMLIKIENTNIEINTNINIDTELYINGNVNWFKQIIINLIDNAIKYNKENGKIIIEAYQENKKIYIIIEDTGIGINEKHLDRLFERFYRVDKSRSKTVGGTGLGLAIVKHALMNLNGSIDVESKEKIGTKFTIQIPT
jgi:two-component system phosphate regulon sensor histidine kinase PhoR